jgi:hypothetical protein
MTDEEILAHYRSDNPYITLNQARRLHRLELRFGHLGRIKQLREHRAHYEAWRALRERLFGVREDG